MYMVEWYSLLVSKDVWLMVSEEERKSEVPSILTCNVFSVDSLWESRMGYYSFKQVIPQRGTRQKSYQRTMM